MKTLAHLFFYLILGVFSLQAQDNQNYTIEVTSDEEPILGANICIQPKEGKASYMVSDADGRVEIESSKYATVSISYVGFKTVFLTLDNEQNIKVNLEVDLFNLNEVVVTAQVGTVTKDQSIYKITTIDQDVLESRQVQNVDEALRFQANIQLSQDPALGSQIIMQGLTGEHIKIMIDGIPVTGRLGGNIDLTQIPTSNIDHIEIIDGPMSVVYGSNALGGTINIITKKNKYYSLKANADVYWESVNFTTANVNASVKKGNHGLDLTLGGQFFQGYEFDEETRQKEWSPKNLYTTNLAYRYDKDELDFQIGTRLNWEQLTYLGPYTSANRAFDTEFLTNRQVYFANFNYKQKWSSQLAYSVFDRSSQRYFVKEDQNTSTPSGDPSEDLFYDWNYRLSYKGILADNLELKAGYELTTQNGAGEKLEVQQNLMENALWMDISWEILPGLQVQPGLRYMFHNTYEPPLIYAGHLKYANSGWTARVSYAKGFRAPSLKELYMDFVDSNHLIFGNPDLKPETSNSWSGSLTKNWVFESKKGIRFQLNGFYNHLFDVIELAQIENSQSFDYQNISEKKTKGFNAGVTYKHSSVLQLNFGYNFTGTAYNMNVSDTFDFNYTHDTTASINYNWNKPDIHFRLDYKFNGARPFIRIDENNNAVTTKSGEFNSMNFTLNKSFQNNNWQIGLGAKNLFDVTSVAANSQGAHSTGATLIDWGRTFFINLKFNLNHI